MPRTERRKSVRYTVKQCTARFRRRRMMLFFEGTPHKGPVVDLSSHGISFLTKRTLHQGDIVLIGIDLPFEVYAVPPGFQLKAQARWVEAVPGQGKLKRVGCAFHKLTDEEQELITRVIRFGILREK